MTRPNVSPHTPAPTRYAMDPTLTVDTFIAEVPIDPHPIDSFVYLREQLARAAVYVRWRLFLQSTPERAVTGIPDKRRAFVVTPLEVPKRWPVPDCWLCGGREGRN